MGFGNRRHNFKLIGTSGDHVDNFRTRFLEEFEIGVVWSIRDTSSWEEVGHSKTARRSDEDIWEDTQSRHVRDRGNK